MRLLVPVAVVAVGALAFGLIWFQPWKLWVDPGRCGPDAADERHDLVRV